MVTQNLNTEQPANRGVVRTANLNGGENVLGGNTRAGEISVDMAAETAARYDSNRPGKAMKNGKE